MLEGLIYYFNVLALVEHCRNAGEKTLQLFQMMKNTDSSNTLNFGNCDDVDDGKTRAVFMFVYVFILQSTLMQKKAKKKRLKSPYRKF